MPQDERNHQDVADDAIETSPGEPPVDASLPSRQQERPRPKALSSGTARSDRDAAIEQAPHRKSPIRIGLPGKLLLLTALFVMLSEVLIFVPSVSNFRINWFQDRLAAARLAALAGDAAPGGEIPKPVRDDLLRTAEVQAVAIGRDGMRRLVLPADVDKPVADTYDLRPMEMGTRTEQITNFAQRIGEAVVVLMAASDRNIRIIGPLDDNAAHFIEVVIPEQPLRDAMLRFGFNILLLSVVISLLTAALVYIALSNLLVRPMMRISKNMVRFADNPEDPDRIIVPSDRKDEIGIAEQELAEMQRQLVGHLVQKNRLAQLGLAVSKINHDLRNMLASAQLLSDRLTAIPDPGVQRFAPKLIASLDRAINFCNETLRYGRAEEAAPRRSLIPLAPIVREVADALALPRDGELRPREGSETRIDLVADIPDGLVVDVDPDHLHRVLINLCRNAVQILETTGPGPGADRDQAASIRIKAWREGRRVIIEFRDNGPGLPPRAREHLFRAFQGSSRKGGTGLGLVIASELVTAHGGHLRLLEAGIEMSGAAFELIIPDRHTY